MSFDDLYDEDESEESEETQWVLFRLDERRLAVPVESVRELITQQEITPLPEAPQYILGLITLRDLTIPVIDLRTRLGMKSLKQARDALMETLKAAKREHEKWLEELKSSVKERREFTEQVDASQCDFGKWIKTFQTDDLVVSGLIKKMETIHTALHEAVLKIRDMKEEDAEKAVSAAELGEMKKLKDVIDSTVEEFGRSSRQVIMVAEIEEATCGFLVDRIDSVINLLPEDIGPPPKVSGAQASGKLLGVARPKGSKDMVLLLDPKTLADAGEIESLIEV